jgi:Na+/melibiose symporter-like transporter
MIPVEQGLLTSFGANDALLMLALMASLMIPIAFMLREPNVANAQQGNNQTIKEALKEAIHNPSFKLLTLGYFVCGFQVVFIAVHLAPYLKDLSKIYPDVGAPAVATTALALIGLFNIFGTYSAGILGQRFPKLVSKPCSTGIIKNCPNDPAAAAIPIAHTRFSATTLRPKIP